MRTGVQNLEKEAALQYRRQLHTGDKLDRKLMHGNHRSEAKCGEEVLTKAAVDVARGKASVFPVTQAKEIMGLRISSVEVVEATKKLQIIHDLTFSGGPGECTEEKGDM